MPDKNIEERLSIELEKIRVAIEADARQAAWIGVNDAITLTATYGIVPYVQIAEAPARTEKRLVKNMPFRSQTLKIIQNSISPLLGIGFDRLTIDDLASMSLSIVEPVYGLRSGRLAEIHHFIVTHGLTPKDAGWSSPQEYSNVQCVFVPMTDQLSDDDWSALFKLKTKIAGHGKVVKFFKLRNNKGIAKNRLLQAVAISDERVDHFLNCLNGALRDAQLPYRLTNRCSKSRLDPEGLKFRKGKTQPNS